MRWSGEVEVVRATDRALLVAYELQEIWIPKSQIDDDSSIYSSKQVGEKGELVLPEWLADEKGLTS